MYLIPGVPTLQETVSHIQFCSDFQSETSYERTKDVLMHINDETYVSSRKINYKHQTNLNVMKKSRLKNKLFKCVVKMQGEIASKSIPMVPMEALGCICDEKHGA